MMYGENSRSPRSCSSPKLVIFDCDGTLVDSQHVIIRAMKSAFEKGGLACPEAEEIRSIIGLSLHEAVRTLAPRQDPMLTETLVEYYKNAFIEQRQEADFHEPLFNGARDILKSLSACPDVLLGVATGKSRRGVDVLFEREGLAGYFYTIQTADDAPSKPHPGMIDNAIKASGVERQHVWMVGDTSFDMEMACNAGVRAVGVGWGYHERERLLEAGAHHLVESFDEIGELLALFAPETGD